jgi:hypothetical protein
MIKHHHLCGMYQFGPLTDATLQGLIGSASLGVLTFTTSEKDICIATNDEIQGLFMNINQVQIDQHGYKSKTSSHTAH